jgi:2,4-dienoyl-CoA reductase-like NADH-dependent reductase (Old Yellow Enzyme family)
MKRTTSSFALASALAMAMVFLSGCAAKAQYYQLSVDNLSLIKSAPKPMAVGAFTVNAATTGASSIGLRASSMESPVGENFAAYLADALRQELSMAGKLDAKSSIEISGLLLKNDIAAGGMSTNSGEIEARFLVKVAGVQRYDKTHRAEMTWESSFLGAVAISKAHQQYPLIVQKLLTQLLSDPAFQAAIK